MQRLRSVLSSGIVILMCPGFACAQAPAPEAQLTVGGEASRVVDAADPAALPGDFVDMPQDRQLTVNLGPPAGTRATRPPAVDPTPSPGAALALEAVQAAVEACAADGYVVVAAVTDAAGKLKAALSPDGARPNGVYMAIRKDVTAAAFGMSTLELREQLTKDPSLRARVKPNMSLLPGGLPLMRGSVLVGAISTSGAAAYEEEKCARAGIAKIASRLNAMR